ncbi:sarcosine oxidase subunit alpha family protein [Streptomyces rapamycinicus]|uniref:Sarcosine oxidase subunit alpha n=2 Tax=Streptomyces rapamycinicus TaxID=1226757 RepID=A0A0A0N7W6_STRRN|nr:sarcosine oxidase subunit alpha family protein [Streptomyces rapamycinicus]AGP52108.1 ferredoxin [Streptomyces rapamycinicus NRRL 5491]MBB4779548.1 sarcosine oxidase subunit alpha [Streptomyces rapamycinicus]RLV75790.1 ferredoxin [Streptomyces rapamycinicus NRRL 5491]UTP28313.1 sarcosine oxidase subunit alpha family protein [Streptomyces rapamycinicus NRRL 5491]
MTDQPRQPDQHCRLRQGGRIERGTVLRFTVDGRELTGHPGDTVASAMLANGVAEVAPSIYRGRPRGIVAAGVEEPNALVQLAGSCSEGMLPATTVELYEGLSATTLSGMGRLDPTPDPAVYDKKYVHTDVLVIGAGPAGLAAAAAAAGSGARVILLDDQPEPGGSLLSGRAERVGAQTALEWVAEVHAALDAAPEAVVLRRTSAFGSYDDNYVLAVQRRTDHLGADAPGPSEGVSRQRLWHIRARQVVLATGAHERPLVFAGNDRPGVMLAAAVRSYVNRYAVAPGSRAVVSTTNDSAYDTVADLHAAGIGIAAVVDARPELSRRAAEVATATGVRVLTGSAVVGTAGGGRLTGVTVQALDEEGQLTGGPESFDCDLLAVSGGWSPVVHLHSQRQGRLRWDADLVAFVPDGTVRDQRVVGAARGTYDLDGCLADGALAGARAATDAGFPVPLPSPENTRAGGGPIRALWLVPAPEGGPGGWDTHFVDLQRDATVAGVRRSTGSGMRGVEHVKRYTSLGTANDQGKTSGVNAIGVIAEILGAGASPGEIGTTAYRAPYTPVAFAALAGRERGELFDPERMTSIHHWHVAQGAVFEDVGQWKRPWYYPRPGEDMDTAVARECRAAREGVAFMDASTLGKIEIWGRDAGEFLGRVYTNGFKKLRPGMARYGVMCKPDGMIFDDGVTLRLEENRYFMTTTTGGAAGVLDWLEEWLQTEWPELDVHCTSVTEQWATIAVVGPQSREVVAHLAPDVDFSNEAFPFMALRETTLASGIPARICRISFSGELAYEINVSAWYGPAVWEEVYAVGRPYDITPYGTETMHVLRAEKGYIIVGQDTDGTVTPQDAGMSWVVSKQKDFIGKRSYSRPDTSRTDRKHLVGLVPSDRSTRLPEGTQLIAPNVPVTPGAGPVPMLGHVTSSYHSQALGRPFALALVTAGRDRVGDTLLAPVGDDLVPVQVTDPVLYDPEGTKRDG